MFSLDERLISILIGDELPGPLALFLPLLVIMVFFGDYYGH